MTLVYVENVAIGLQLGHVRMCHDFIMTDTTTHGDTIASSCCTRLYIISIESSDVGQTNNPWSTRLAGKIYDSPDLRTRRFWGNTSTGSGHSGKTRARCA